MNGYIWIHFFFQNSSILHVPQGRQATVHPYPRDLPFICSLSSNLRAITFWKRWWLFWKRESYLGLLVDYTCLKAKDKQFWKMQFLSIFWKRHILCWNLQGPFQPKPILYFEEKEKSKPTVFIFHIKIVTERCSVSKAAHRSCCSPADGQNLVQITKPKSSVNV